MNDIMMTIKQILGINAVLGQINMEKATTDSTVNESMRMLFDYLPYILTGICIAMTILIVVLTICLIISRKKRAK